MIKKKNKRNNIVNQLYFNERKKERKRKKGRKEGRKRKQEKEGPTLDRVIGKDPLLQKADI